MSKPIQSKNDLINFLSEEFDPINLSLTRINNTMKATLIFEDDTTTMLFRLIESVYKEVKDTK